MRHILLVATVLFSICWLQACSKESPESNPTDSAVKESVTESKPESASVITLTPANFDDQIAEGVVLVDFWATWCPPCKKQSPIVEAVAEMVAGKARVAKLDVDQAKDLARKYETVNIPTLIVFKDAEPVKRFVGLTEADVLRDAVLEALK